MKEEKLAPGDEASDDKDGDVTTPKQRDSIHTSNVIQNRYSEWKHRRTRILATATI